jgi:hypothetical protein
LGLGRAHILLKRDLARYLHVTQVNHPLLYIWRGIRVLFLHQKKYGSSTS